MKESKTTSQKIKRHLSPKRRSNEPAGIRRRFVRIMVCSLLAFLVLPCLARRSAFAASITLTVPTGRLTLSAVADGNFHESAAATVSVKSDAYSGYTLGVKSGESSKPALKSGSNTIPSISSAMTGSSFPVNTWGWLPSKLGGQANSQYQPGPTSTFVTIEKTTSPNASTANSYTIKLGAKVNGTIPAGTYVNTFTFTATANPVPYTISYNTNGAGTVTGTSGNAVEGTQITLANAPTKSGYDFKGWCTVSSSNETCPSTGKSYEAGGKYTLTNSANNVTLWAMWKQTLPTMQSWGLNECAKLTTGDTVTLMDARDGNSYRVRKLVDGKCWMIDNLRLGDSKLTNRKLTSDNTDLNDGLKTYDLPNSSKDSFKSSDYTVQSVYVVESDSSDGKELKSYGGYYTFNAATAGTGTSVTVDGDFSASGDAPSSICPKGWGLPKGGHDSGDFKTLNDILGGATDSDAHLVNPDGPNFLLAGYSSGSTSIQGGAGYYWSSTYWPFAKYGYSLNFNSTSVNTGYFGWPYYGYSIRCVPTAQYSISYNLTGGSGGPNPNPQTGAAVGVTTTLDSTIPTKCGYAFQYWCSTSNTSSPTTCSGTHYDAGAAYPLSSGANTTLYAVWKTTGTDLGNLGTMQSFSCSSKIPSIGGFGTVTDTRDNNTYCVRRLVDNKCWMTSNLRLGDSKLTNRTLTPANTDLNGITSYTLPNSSKDGFRKGSTGDEVVDINVENIYVVEADYTEPTLWGNTELKAYGGYYTWNAATAGTGASTTYSSRDASSSICPKGWRLPTGDSDGDFKVLNDALGGVTDNDAHLINPDGPAFLRAGIAWDGSAGTTGGSGGNYWSSKATFIVSGALSSIASSMQFSSNGSGVYPVISGTRYAGYSVRCIAR